MQPLIFRYPVFVPKNHAGDMRRAAPASVDTAEALMREWPFDAHVTQYEGDRRRHSSNLSPENPAIFTQELYDFDHPRKTELETLEKLEALDPSATTALETLQAEVRAWSRDCLNRLPPGFAGYETAHGFRAITLRSEPFVVSDYRGPTWVSWMAYHGGRAKALGLVLGAAPDHATDDPMRVFRLPNVRREGKPSFPEIWRGEQLGYADLRPLPHAVGKQEKTSAPPLPSPVQIPELVQQAAAELVEAWPKGGDRHKAWWALGALCARQGVDLNPARVLAQAVHEGAQSTHRDPLQQVENGWADPGSASEVTLLEALKDKVPAAEHDYLFDRILAAVRLLKDSVDLERGEALARDVLNGAPTPEQELEARRTLDAIEVERKPCAPPPAKQSSPFLDFDALLEISARPIEWLCKDLQLAPGRPGALVAAPNTGKSWALAAIALAVAGSDDAKIFDRFECNHGPVLHISTDAGEYATSNCYRRMAEVVGRPKHPIRVWPGRVRCVNPRTGQFDASQPGWKAIVAEVERAAAAGAPYALVIFDSLFAVAAGVEMNSPEAAEPLYATRSWGTTSVLWAMHTPKNKPDGVAYGSVAIEAACGVMWKMALETAGDKTSPRVWTQQRRAEENDGDTVETFRTEWKDKARIVYLEPATPASVGAEDRAREIQRIRLAILRGFQNSAHGDQGGTGELRAPILERIEGPPTLVESVFDTLVKQCVIERGGRDKGSGNKNTSKYRLCNGVVVPCADHEPLLLAGAVVAVEDPRPPSKRPEMRRALRAAGKVA